MAAPLGHTFINIHLSHNSRLYCANLRLGCTPRHIVHILIVYRLYHARIGLIHRVRLQHAPVIGWNKPSINNRSLRFTGHKRRVTKRRSYRQYRSHRSRDQR